MKKKIISLLLAVVMIVGMIPLGAITAFAAITPETGNPELVIGEDGAYHITSAEDWTKFGNMVTAGSNTFEDKTVVLDADLAVEEQIGKWAEDGSQKYFSGTFDGNGHTVTFTNTDNTGNKGVFAYTVGAEISNLKIDGEIKGDWSLGGVVGCAKDTKITNCENRASVSSTGTGNIAYAGGIVGVSEGGNVISGCENYGSITGNKAIGGIIGEARVDDEIINCINDGDVSGNLYIGGILGNTPDKDNTITVKNCINYGDITVTDGNAGGIAGHMAYSGTLVNCFTSGKVSANGGIVVGWGNRNFTCDNIYYDNTVSENSGLSALVLGKDFPTTPTFTVSEVAGRADETMLDTMNKKALTDDDWYIWINDNGRAWLVYSIVTPEKAATCVKTGHLAYYKRGENYYADANCTDKIESLNTWLSTDAENGGGMLPTTNVHDYKAYTFSQHKCSVCGATENHSYSEGKCTGCGTNEPKNTTYIERYWDGSKVVEIEKPIPSDAQIITSSNKYIALDAGWNVVTEDVTVSGGISVSGMNGAPTNLILMDGCTLTVENGIYLELLHVLNIYGQKENSGLLRSYGADGKPGIGCDEYDPRCGDLTVYGGIVNAYGGDNAVGIGATGGSYGGNVTVYGGVVNASGNGAAGIGNSEQTYGGNLTVYGGSVRATGDGAPGFFSAGDLHSKIGVYGGQLLLIGDKDAEYDSPLFDLKLCNSAIIEAGTDLENAKIVSEYNYESFARIHCHNAATCESIDDTQHSCHICDITENHTVVTDAAVAPSCVDGLTEGSHCSGCGKIIVPQTAVPATGTHVWKYHTNTEHKCAFCDATEKHNYINGVCSCGKKETDSYECEYLIDLQSDGFGAGHIEIVYPVNLSVIKYDIIIADVMEEKFDNIVCNCEIPYSAGYKSIEIDFFQYSNRITEQFKDGAEFLTVWFTGPENAEAPRITSAEFYKTDLKEPTRITSTATAYRDGEEVQTVAYVKEEMSTVTFVDALGGIMATVDVICGSVLKLPPDIEILKPYYCFYINGSMIDDIDNFVVTESATITLIAPDNPPEKLLDGYFLIGTLGGVDYTTIVALSNSMRLSESGTDGEYKINWEFAEGDEIKIVKVFNGAITAWYKADGADYYKIGADEAGEKTLYFRPEGNAEWDYFYLKVMPCTSYAVTFDMQRHGTQIDAQEVEPGGKVARPADPTAEGFTFDGWYKEANCVTPWNFDTDTVSSNTTLYAKWSTCQHYYVDYICKYCHAENLEGAQNDAVRVIQNTVDHSEDAVLKLLEKNAVDAIQSAGTVAEVIVARNYWLTAINKQLGSEAHTHTFADTYSHNDTHHWRVCTCEDEKCKNLVDDFSVHTFTVVTNDDGSKTCTCVCGYTKIVYDKTGDDEGEIVTGVSYTGISLTLGSDISINFYMNLSDEARQNGTMTFNIGGRIVTVDGKDTKYNETEKKYYFQTPLTALEMAETVTATFTYNGIDYVQEYSAQQYIEAILNGKDKDGKPYSDEMKLLARKIANYGYYAQIYLESIHTNVHIVNPYTEPENGYDRVEPFGGEFDINTQKAIEALASYKVEVSGTSDNLSFYGSTVYFDAATALNYYITVKNGIKPTATAVNTVTGKKKDVEIKLYKGNIYIVSVKDITATELADDIEVKINNELTITGSAFAYCNSVVKAHDFDGATEKDSFAVNAMAAFYEYYEAAVDYAKSIQMVYYDVPTFKEDVAPLYDGTKKSVDDPSYWNGYDPDYMTIKDFTATECGKYTATFSLKQNVLSKWSDGTTEDKTAEWGIRYAYAVILDGTMTFKMGTETGDEYYPVSEAETDEGILWYLKRKNVSNVVFDESFALYAPKRCEYWFYGFENLTQVKGLQYLNLSEATTTQRMFSGCERLSRLNSDADGVFDLSALDMSNIENAKDMFYNCDSLYTLIGPGTSENPSSFSSSGCSLEQFCYDCHNLTVVDFRNCDISNVTSFYKAFYGDCKLQTAYFSRGVPGSENNKKCIFTQMFDGGDGGGDMALKTVYCEPGADWGQYSIDSAWMFSHCVNLVGGEGTKCDGQNNIEANYAKDDRASINSSGYFTSITRNSETINEVALSTVGNNGLENYGIYRIINCYDGRELKISTSKPDSDSSCYKLETANDLSSTWRAIFDGNTGFVVFESVERINHYMNFYGGKPEANTPLCDYTRGLDDIGSKWIVMKAGTTADGEPQYNILSALDCNLSAHAQNYSNPSYLVAYYNDSPNKDNQFWRFEKVE